MKTAIHLNAETTEKENRPMIEMIDIGIENVIAYRIQGKVTDDEMRSILSVLKAKIDQNQKINIYQEIVSLGGVTPEALIEKLNLQRGTARFN